MAKRKSTRQTVQVVPPNISVAEFLEGETLIYAGYSGAKTEATFRVGVGILLERDGVDLGTAAVIEDRDAKRAYHNLTRGHVQEAVA